MRKGLLILCGSVSAGLGIAGIFLPLLPTTPFLLLAAYCYSHSSEKFYRWLLNNKLCGPYISAYRKNSGISKRHKITAIVFLWISITISAIFFVTALWARIILVIIACGVTIHLARMKTLEKRCQKK
ncbi:MAG: YbaN family protein [Dissulfurispiraceae bacterium]|nr:YbaN family protein [Dissulfurispiraceae bacterium]